MPPTAGSMDFKPSELTGRNSLSESATNRDVAIALADRERQRDGQKEPVSCV